jgi:DnaJ-domain-containing protein 1
MATPLFCDDCGTDYPERRGMTSFGILGLEPTFSIPTETIDELENNLVARLHPDRWQSRGTSLHRKALIAQAAVNEALEEVRTPFRRAETLLSVLPHAPDFNEETRPGLPTPFLIQQLELQEEIEDGLSRERKRELTTWVRSELKELRAVLDSEFQLVEKSNETQTSRDSFERIQNAVDRSRYWRNIQRSLRGQLPT